MERYTAINGEVIEYPTPDAKTAAFLARVIAATNDPRVSEGELVELVYGKENPILDQTLFPGRGAVTADVFENPLYHVMSDLICQKQVLEGRFDRVRAAERYTLSVNEAAEVIGVTPDAVRKAIKAHKIPAWQREGSWRLDPRDVETYKTHVVPRKPRSGGSERKDSRSPALRVRAGSEPGRSLRIKAPNKRVVTKAGSITELEVDAFERAAVATTSTKTLHVFILEPSDAVERLEWGPLGIEGRFRVVEKITNERKAAEAWKAFRAS